MSEIYTDPPQSRNEAIIKATIDGTEYTAPPQSRMEDLLLELKEVIEQGGGGGTSDYSQLSNKPSINDVTLSGNKTSADLGLMPHYDLDEAPTESSENLITSGAVWSADKSIKDKLQGSKVVEGNPITVTDAEPMNAESVKVELEPKQDLHGYDKPWAGGAGKNKLPYFTVEEQNGISLTYDNGVVILNGTASANAFFDLTNLNFASGTYTFSANNTEVNSGVHIALRGIGADSDFADLPMNDSDKYNTYRNISIGQVTLYVISGTQLTNFRLPLQIEVGDSKTDFEPYSNICPISGYSEVNVERDGVNYAINTLENLKTLNTTGTWDSNRYTINGVTFTASVDAEGNVTSINLNGTSGAGYTRLILRQNESLGKFVGGKLCAGSSSNRFGIVLQQSGGRYTYYASAGSEKTDIGSFQDGAVGSLYMSCDPEITYNNVVAKPALYDNQGNTYTIDLDSTKYGGILDVTEGGYSDEWGYISGSSISDLQTWATSAGVILEINATASDILAISFNGITNGVNNQTVVLDNQLLCNTLDRDTAENQYHYNETRIAVNDSGNVIFKVKDITTQADMDTWLSNNPIQIAYRKKTPSSVSTAPTDIPLLENTNNISTDGTNITLKYQPNNVIGECKKYTDEQCAKVLPQPPTIDGTYHLECSVNSGIPTITWVLNS